MTMDDILLMAYVDGELMPREREDVEKTIGVSPEIAERVAVFAASTLRYQHAFAQQKLPPVPERLTLKIAQLSRAYADVPEASGSARRSTAEPARFSRLFSRLRLRFRFPLNLSLPVLAMTFAAGALSCALVLRFATDWARNDRGANASALHAAAASVSPWVAAAVNYQQLYTRDTVAFDALTPEVASQVIAQIHSNDGVPIRVPDLRPAGLTFTRIQRLRFHNRPLVQIVYLPQTGLPVALCVMKDEKPDASMTHEHVESMNVLTWRRAKLSYALIASLDDDQLLAIGKQIAKGQTDETVGQVAPRGNAAG
ncbi:anti-sigma factor [Paraburkholderia sp. CNPSo 3281]|uniref:anti-sigma factor family protein n=1 Tax=Paraburkholderia sp. CNPSo 3281 TaxID=2940933 RepID=UPI0020B70D91|nr:anti-sigma factor [Paraburkholderia sp. CNPSo 3281]MCP3718327.1 anti-sigma factor [Paraburkholderia sp. CNPSo 3281]